MVVGSPGFMAPEQAEGLKSGRPATSSAWALSSPSPLMARGRSERVHCGAAVPGGLRRAEYPGASCRNPAPDRALPGKGSAAPADSGSASRHAQHRRGHRRPGTRRDHPEIGSRRRGQRCVLHRLPAAGALTQGMGVPSGVRAQDRADKGAGPGAGRSGQAGRGHGPGPFRRHTGPPRERRFAQRGLPGRRPACRDGSAGHQVRSRSCRIPLAGAGASGRVPVARRVRARRVCGARGRPRLVRDATAG